MKQEPTLNVNVVIKQKLNWKVLAVCGLAFSVGVLYGKISMAKEQEEKNNG